MRGEKGGGEKEDSMTFFLLLLSKFPPEVKRTWIWGKGDLNFLRK